MDADPEIVSFYARGTAERDRFDDAPGQLELQRTQELLRRFLPPPPARVLDVGGGPGTYAGWLAERGHEVALYDLTPSLVAQARARAGPGGAFTAEVADARSLPEPAAAADAVLLLGPLYHLPERADRDRALREARRVLRPGGVAVAAAIGHVAALLDTARMGLLDDATAARMATGSVATGRHDARDGFTTAYFHRPAELADELAAAGFREIEVVAVEGPGWLLFEHRAPGEPRPPGDDDVLATALRLARATESDPSLAGASAHLLAVGRVGEGI